MDTINYINNGDGTFTKIVTHTEVVTDVSNEVKVIQAQLTDIKLGDDQSSIGDIIENYQQAIATLQSLNATIKTDN